MYRNRFSNFSNFYCTLPFDPLSFYYNWHVNIEWWTWPSKFRNHYWPFPYMLSTKCPELILIEALFLNLCLGSELVKHAKRCTVLSNYKIHQPASTSADLMTFYFTFFLIFSCYCFTLCAEFGNVNLRPRQSINEGVRLHLLKTQDLIKKLL